MVLCLQNDVEMSIPPNNDRPPQNASAEETGQSTNSLMMQFECAKLPPELLADVQSPEQQYFITSPLIYSEPALPSAFTNGVMATCWAYSDMALQQV